MRIFVVSLAGHQRRKQITKSLGALGVDFEFFDAVDGSNLTGEQKKLIDVKATLNNIPAGLNDGEYACALSHALIYKKVISERIPNALILEDDALVNDDLKRMLSARVFENSKFDLIMLCYLKAWRKKCSLKPFFEGYRSFTLWNAPFRTAGYYINLKAAKNLNRVAIPISSTADWPIGAFKGILAACLEPQLVIHPDASIIESTLEVKRKSKEIFYKENKKPRSFLSKYKRKILTSYFVPKRNNNKLPHFWLKLLGSKINW